MEGIRVLDVTLRDGGCVIDFNFGLPYMQKIRKAIETSGVDIVELGYIDSKNGSQVDRTKFCDEKAIYNSFLLNKKPGLEYVAMIDHGRYDPKQLERRNTRGIDGIRYCFHKKDFKSIPEICKTVHEKGYKIYVQPMITLRYSDAELEELISLINQEAPFVSGFYIVDSFGEMRANDLQRLVRFVDQRLGAQIALGLHSHNNLQLSYSNAMDFIRLALNRPIMIDSSVMGMGKGAGNLNTELLLEHLNLFYGGHYSIESLLQVIDEVIKPIHSEHYWGYSAEYFLSSKYRCTPSYASYFYNKHMVSIDNVAKLLSRIDEIKRISFDKGYAEKLYEQFIMSERVDDSSLISALTMSFLGKSALLIAPGPSILLHQEEIRQLAQRDDIVSISLNTLDYMDVDYHFITRPNLDMTSPKNGKRIFASNVYHLVSSNDFALDIKKYILVDDGAIQNSSSILFINLLLSLGVGVFFLAGFDGFSSVASKNYYRSELRTGLDYEQACSRNSFYRSFFRRLRAKAKVVFVTPSAYGD